MNRRAVDPVLDLYYFARLPLPVAEMAEQLMESLPVSQVGRSAPTAKERMHVTVQSLGRHHGRIPRDVLDKALAVGDGLKEDVFVLALDQVRFRGGENGKGIVELVGVGSGGQGMHRFRRSLVSAVRVVAIPGVHIRSRFEPHVTLDYSHDPITARRLERPIAWRVTEFCLVASHYGQGRHEVLQRWPLIERQRGFEGW